ncbi:MAG: phosphoribosylglycinamide formyltransferase [Candidatus Saccharibacteria bacterium]|nr:phosphoribosylglycinamide formyltransferase [Candidatus Saccharibacteria bacterium]
MSDRPKIAILASGSGTTAEALIHATQSGVLDADVRLVITNKEDAGILQKIERFNRQDLDIKVLVINGQTHPGDTGRGEQTPAEAQAIYDAVKEYDIDLILLLGYLRKVMPPLLDLQILNTHPGLLPITRGLHGEGVQQFVLENHHEFTGQTLHEVIAEYDSGRIVAEHKLPVMSWDTVESLNATVQIMEKAYIGVEVDAYLKSL